jgi:predicted Zn finger-like uncharacterized protein
MAIVCPRCATPAALSAEIVHLAGRMLRCTRCNTTWFARVHTADTPMTGSGESPYLAVRGSGRPRFEQIVEHDRKDTPRQGRVLPVGRTESGRDGKPRASRGLGRRLLGGWLGAVAAVAVCGLVAILAVQSAVVGAAPAVDTAQFAGLEIRLVRATIERVHNQKAVIVIGEIANRTDADLAVPAVRIALLSDGSEHHAWLHRPVETRLGAGVALTFRSMLTSPPAGVDEVAFRLAERPNTVVGMH